MAVCPITLAEIPAGSVFSAAGLRSLHPRLKRLATLELTHEEQLRQARLRADKMSVQGVQPKLSAVLNVAEGKLGIVDTGGRFILKPNPPPYAEVPANEALTMTMAALAGIDVPPHGLVPAVDGSWVYVVKRYDRTGRSGKVHVEDFAQLCGETRDTKHNSTLERVANVVEDFCTFPAIEKAKLARRALFCFLTGNEDMHLKNWSLMRDQGRVTLSPAYDLLNTTVVLERALEETALPLHGRKKNLTKENWLDYFCKERLQLPDRILDGIVNDLSDAAPSWRELIGRSFLSPAAREAYTRVLNDRLERLGLTP
jgi:serine/threonine-protein kinase HipA